MSTKSFFSQLGKKLPFFGTPDPLVTVLELNGAIGASGGLGRGLSAAKLAPLIEAAFKPDKLDAVALAINSPGGSPVQSNLIHGAIRAAAAKKKVPVIAFVEDVAASGGYILAIAADEIYADPSSIVGSIGVVSAGFGFDEAIAKLGVERRVHTAGESKSQLDPFKPESPEDVARLDAILAELHRIFIDLVKQRRGGALKDGFEDTFTGAFWPAAGAQARGLIDGTGRLNDFLKSRFGEDVRIRRISARTSPLKRLTGAAGSSGLDPAGFDPAGFDPAAWALGAVSAANELALWRRFGR